MSQTTLADRYPSLNHLFGAYFHQDWTVDGSTTDGAVGRFIRDEGAATAQRTATELDHLLRESRSDSELAAALDTFGCYYTPAAKGVTHRTWLARVGQILSAAG